MRVRERIAKDYLASFHNRCQAVYEKILKIVFFPGQLATTVHPADAAAFFTSRRSLEGRRKDGDQGRGSSIAVVGG